MARAPLFRTDLFAYHAFARSNNRESFYIPLEECWEIFTQALILTSERYSPEIHLFVLMPNHFHMVLSTPKKNLDEVMRYFLSTATYGVQRRAGRINHVFGGRYRWSLLESKSALSYAYKYVARNPVRAGLSSLVEEYPFSTVATLPTGFPQVEGFSKYWSLIPKLSEDRLHWLNQQTVKEQEDLIGRALRRYHFQFTTENGYQKQLRALRNSYGVEEG